MVIGNPGTWATACGVTDWMSDSAMVFGKTRNVLRLSLVHSQAGPLPLFP